VIRLLTDSVCDFYDAVNKSISCSRVFIPVGEGQANEDLQLSFPAYYLLPPSVSSVKFYIRLLYSLTESHPSLPPPLLVFGFIFRRICKIAKGDY
jgi:hypothetical protein